MDEEKILLKEIVEAMTGLRSLLRHRKSSKVVVSGIHSANDAPVKKQRAVNRDLYPGTCVGGKRNGTLCGRACKRRDDGKGGTIDLCAFCYANWRHVESDDRLREKSKDGRPGLADVTNVTK